MRLLALDTATLSASVAIWQDGAVVAAGDARAETHSEKLLPLIDTLLRLAGLTARDLDAIACGAGPGSFTGLRIGLATAKGLCFALGKPLLLVSSLRALAVAGAAEAARQGTQILALLDARKREVYAGIFDADLRPQSAEVVLPPARLAAWLAGRPVVVVGDGALAYPDAAAACGPLVDGARPIPDARAVAALAAARLAAGEHDELLTAAPSYVRASEAELVIVPGMGRKLVGMTGKRPRATASKGSTLDELRAEHTALELRLAELDRHRSLSSAEQSERARLKKLKLAMKNRIARLG